MWTRAALQQYSAWASMLSVCKFAEIMVDEVRHVPGAHGLLQCQEPQQNVVCLLEDLTEVLLRDCFCNSCTMSATAVHAAWPPVHSCLYSMLCYTTGSRR